MGIFGYKIELNNTNLKPNEHQKKQNMEIFTQNITVQNIKEVRHLYVQNNHSTKSSNSRESMLVSVLQKTKTKETDRE